MLHKRLNIRLTIEQSTPTRTAAGGVTDVWSEFVQRWGEVKYLSMRQLQEVSQLFPESTLTLRCRGHAAVTPKMRVNCSDGRLFDIVGVTTEDGKAPAYSEMLNLHCKERVSAGS